MANSMQLKLLSINDNINQSRTVLDNNETSSRLDSMYDHIII